MSVCAVASFIFEVVRLWRIESCSHNVISESGSEEKQLYRSIIFIFPTSDHCGLVEITANAEPGSASATHGDAANRDGGASTRQQTAKLQLWSQHLVGSNTDHSRSDYHCLQREYIVRHSRGSRILVRGGPVDF